METIQEQRRRRIKNVRRKKGRVRRKRETAIKKHDANFAPEATLKCGEDDVTGIACAPDCEIVAVSTGSGRVLVYKYSTSGEPIRIFDGHKGVIWTVVHISGDTLASVDSDGMLLTWRATTCVVVDELKVSEHGCEAMARESNGDLLIGSQKGEIILVGHDNGRCLTVRKRFTDERYGNIYPILAYKDLIVSGESNVQIRNQSDGKRLHTIRSYCFRSIAVNEDFVILGDFKNKIFVHEIRNGYKLLRIIDFSNFQTSHLDIHGIADITFLNIDIAMITTGKAGIFFISPGSGQCISHCRLILSMNAYSCQATVLSDGRICVGGTQGSCTIIKPPQAVKDCVHDYTERMYSHPVLALIPFSSPPLKGAFDGLQGKYFSIVHALELATLSKFSCTSIQEWAYAHQIVMFAVRVNAVSRDRKYKNNEVFWWDNLYDKASSLEMGPDDINLVLMFIKEAEAAEILAVGCAELFKKAHILKKELTLEISSLHTTIVNLYSRQLALNEQVEGILRSQKLHQKVAVINAILACIPLAGGVAGHVLSGGTALLEQSGGESLALGGLAESLLGIGREWSSFISEQAAERFIRASNIVLEDENWKGIPKVNRLAVEAAAEVLGLSIEELRARLQSTVLGVLGEPSKSTSIAENTDQLGGVKDRILNYDGNGDAGTFVVDAMSESVGSRDEEIIANRTGGSWIMTQDRYRCLSMGEICKKMEIMELRNDDLERRIKRQEVEKEVMAAQIESLLRK